MDHEAAYNALKRVHDSTNNAVKRLEAENEQLRRMVGRLEAEKQQWEVEKAKQVVIIAKQLGASDAKVHGLENEILGLRERLKDGDIG